MTIKGLFAFDVPQGSRLPSPTRWGAGGANLCSTQKRLFLSYFPDPHSSPSLRASHSCVLTSSHWISRLLYSNKPQCSLMNGIWETKGFPQKQPTNQPTPKGFPNSQAVAIYSHLRAGRSAFATIPDVLSLQ